MRGILLILLATLSTVVFAAENWNCKVNYESYREFHLTIENGKVSGRYLDENYVWKPMVESSGHGYRVSADVALDSAGRYVFYYGSSGWDGDEITFTLTEGKGTADTHLWQDCRGDFRKSVTIECRKL